MKNKADKKDRKCSKIKYMRDDIKKKFLDILFEPEEVERHEKVVAKAPLEDIRTKKQETEKKEEVKVKPQGETKKTAFINLEETKKEDVDIEVSQIKEKINNKDYEFTQNISPIFGVVNGTKKSNEPKVLTDDTQTAKPASSYLGTIISPIFGYDADKSTTTYENYVKERTNHVEEKSEPFEDTMSINVESFKEELASISNEVENRNEEVIEDKPQIEEHKEPENNEERIDDVVNIEPQDEYYSPDDEQLFKELSISDIFKTEEEVKENKEEDKKVSYTSLFDNKED